MTLPPRVRRKFRVTATCWIWTARRDCDGYSHIRMGERVRHGHRVVYELLVGEVGEGLELHHLCGRRACVNPAHLLPVTHAENMAFTRKAAA